MKNIVYIFGAGECGRAILRYLGDAQIAAFIDNDENKQKNKIEGIECISIKEAVMRGAKEDIVLITPGNCAEIENQLKEQNFKRVFCVNEWLKQRRYFKPIIQQESDYKNATPFNRYDSPYPDILEIHKNEKKLFNRDVEVLDIDFNETRQLELIKKMESLELPDWPYEKSNMEKRYYYNNSMFGKGSADALYYMIRIMQPKNIIEVGSGYSTAVMLDTNERYFENKINIFAIEPRLDRLNRIIKTSDKLHIHEKDLQEVPTNFFEMLEENDILFIDSSHVCKMNSDVNYLFFEILPRLKKGVYIHFHDMMYPFIYPKEWIYDGVAYNEMYILRAFLMNNKKYSIQLFGDMLQYKYNEGIKKDLRGCGAGSLWIRKEV